MIKPSQLDWVFAEAKKVRCAAKKKKLGTSEINAECRPLEVMLKTYNYQHRFKDKKKDDDC